MKLPTFSFCMPNYNQAAYLEQAVLRVFGQIVRPDELIVVDDCSTDQSMEVLKTLKQRFSAMRVYRNPENLGTMGTITRLLSLASMDYVFFLAADDLVLPTFLTKSVSMLAQYPSAGLCCSHPAFLDDATEEVDLHDTWFKLGGPCYLSPGEVVKYVPDIWIAGHTSIIKRSSLIEAGGFIPELRWHCDWFLCYVVAFRYGICYIPDPLCALRIVPTSYSHLTMRDPVQQTAVLKYMADLLMSDDYADVSPAFKKSGVLQATYPEHLDIFAPILNG